VSLICWYEIIKNDKKKFFYGGEKKKNKKQATMQVTAPFENGVISTILV
jgi:hypothetical protein